MLQWAAPASQDAKLLTTKIKEYTSLCSIINLLSHILEHTNMYIHYAIAQLLLVTGLVTMASAKARQVSGNPDYQLVCMTPSVCLETLPLMPIG